MAVEEPGATDRRVREPLRVVVDPHERAAVVRLVGELDADQAPGLRNLLAERVLTGPGHLVLDVSGLTFLDSSGLATLIAVSKGLRAAGSSLVLAGPTPAIVKLLTLTGLRTVLLSAATVQEALASLPDPR